MNFTRRNFLRSLPFMPSVLKAMAKAQAKIKPPNPALPNIVMFPRIVEMGDPQGFTLTREQWLSKHPLKARTYTVELNQDQSGHWVFKNFNS